MWEQQHQGDLYRVSFVLIRSYGTLTNSIIAKRPHKLKLPKAIMRACGQYIEATEAAKAALTIWRGFVCLAKNVGLR